MKKLLVFLVLFLFNLGNIEAAEKNYINVGWDPVEKDFCRKHKLQTFSLPEDVLVATTAKSRKVSVGWLHKDEEIGWVNKEKSEYVICTCGNSVKFLQIPTELQPVSVPAKEEKSNSVQTTEEKKSSAIAPVDVDAPAKKEAKEEEEVGEEVAEGVVTETTYYEPYYAREQKPPYFWHYEPSYGRGYYGYYGGGHHYGGYRHHHPRHHHPRHHHPRHYYPRHHRHR